MTRFFIFSLSALAQAVAAAVLLSNGLLTVETTTLPALSFGQAMVISVPLLLAAQERPEGSTLETVEAATKQFGSAALFLGVCALLSIVLRAF